MMIKATLILSAAACHGVLAWEAATGHASVSWAPGVTCPAGAFEFDPSSMYGESGYEWVGDVVASIHHIGNPQSCCQLAGGDGIHGIGRFYTLCNPKTGCHDSKRAYTCTIFSNVTGKRPLAGALSGHAQAPVRSIINGVQHAEGANNYANPFVSACRPGKTEAIPGDSNVTIPGAGGGHGAREEGAVCAPWCGCPKAKEGQPACLGGFVECPTDDLPPGTTATPQCFLLGVAPRDFNCALVCDPSDPTGGPASRCPKGAACKPLYSKLDVASAGIFNTGACVYN